MANAKGNNTANATTKEQDTVAKLDLENLDTSELSVEQILKLSQELAKQAERRAQKQFDETITFLCDKLKSMGKTKVDGAAALYEMMDDAEQAAFKELLGAGAKKARAPRGSVVKGVKAHADADSTGARPEPGKTYKFGDVSWTKNPAGKGATKKEFVAAIQSGKTWAEMLVQ